jgi:hypothetical protein
MLRYKVKVANASGRKIILVVDQNSENIPADALDKIEVIDHFNTVGFMKNVSDSEELAMNVKLNDKKICF